MLLSLATGAGKTIIAANLLWRLHEAEHLPKPALFLCDRDELREQAYTKLKAVFGDNARIVETKKGENAAKNARIHIATYQTLGLDDDEEALPASSPSTTRRMPSASSSSTSATAPPGANGPRCSSATPTPSTSA